MLRRITGAVVAALALTGCATVAPSTVSVDDVRNFRPVSIEVKAAPDARIIWATGEEAYIRATGQTATVDAFTPTPQAKAFLADLASQKLKSALDQKLAGVMSGSRPVRVVTTITGVDIPSAGRKILVGGSNQLRADTVILDAKTGQQLTTYRGAQSYNFQGAGLLGVATQALVDDVRGSGGYEMLATTYANDFSRWLTGV
jgi:hypothetical protein